MPRQGARQPRVVKGHPTIGRSLPLDPPKAVAGGEDTRGGWAVLVSALGVHMKTYRQQLDIFVWYEQDGRVLFEGWCSDIATRAQQGRRAVLKDVGYVPF